MTALDALAKPIDYCTSWPDGIPTWFGGTGTEWADCCKAHDEFYASYDGWLGYFGAHYRLAECVASSGFSAMGAIMFAGLCTFGTLLLIHRKNKLTTKPDKRPRDNH